MVCKFHQGACWLWWTWILSEILTQRNMRLWAFLGRTAKSRGISIQEAKPSFLYAVVRRGRKRWCVLQQAEGSRLQKQVYSRPRSFFPAGKNLEAACRNGHKDELQHWRSCREVQQQRIWCGCSRWEKSAKRWPLSSTNQTGLRRICQWLDQRHTLSAFHRSRPLNRRISR